MEEIIRMQGNLLLIRHTVGGTAEAFGEKIGVTRQSINNIVIFDIYRAYTAKAIYCSAI